MVPDYRVVNNHKNRLGEGLFVNDNDDIAWVDILARTINYTEAGVVTTLKISEIPTAIVAWQGSQILVVCDRGLLTLETAAQKFQLKPWDAEVLDPQYRTNDAVLYGKYLLVGFMSMNNPEEVPGWVSVFDSNLKECDRKDNIHIPNSFIVVDDNIYISDSHMGCVNRYSFLDGRLEDAGLMFQYESPVKPDGGCVIDNIIYLALWDGAAISVLDSAGLELQRLQLPFSRPTNCKYSSRKNVLYITSSAEGLEWDGIDGKLLEIPLPSRVGDVQ